MALTVDNASNNRVMVEKIQRRLPVTFKGDDSHGNCFTHVLNLAAKAVVSPFEGRGAADSLDDDKDEDEFELPDYNIDNEDEDEGDVDNQDDAEFAQFLSSIDEDGEFDLDDPDADDSLKEQAAAIAAVLAKVCR